MGALMNQYHTISNRLHFLDFDLLDYVPGEALYLLQKNRYAPRVDIYIGGRLVSRDL
jgi:hypothetical protein